MMPLLVIVGAVFWAEWEPHLSVPGMILGLQLAMVLSIGLSWGTVGATIVVAERPSPPASSPTMTPLNIQFGSNITLTGYNLETEATQLALTLQWHSAGPTSRPYTVYNHLLDREGALITQQDNWPVAGQWPSTCWQAGETVIDQYDLSLPDGLTPGIYTLKTGLYDNRNGSRLTTPDGNDSVSFTVEIPIQ
jgi:hypothetical protein